MKLTYLGTGAAEGWPGLFCRCEYCETARKLSGRNIRTRSQAAVYGEKGNMLLIDLPPDTYAHCLTQGLRLDEVTHLLITHSHHDHFAADELQYRMEWYADCKDRPLHIYGNETVHGKLGDMLLKEHLTEEQIFVHFHEPVYFTPFTAGGFTVTPLKAAHDRNERCLLYIVSDGAKTLLYAHDTGCFPEETWDYIQGRHFDLVSLDCTCGIKQEGSSHMGLHDTVETKKRLAASGCIDEASRVVLNHFSHNGALHYDAMVPAAAPYGLEVSYDGFVMEV